MTESARPHAGSAHAGSPDHAGGGKIVDIDKWVLQRSIERLALDPMVPPLAVNISGRSLDGPSLPHFIRAQLAEHDVDPNRLIIKKTETAAVSDIQDAQRFIDAVHHTGCRVCLDDFGSGFSRLDT